jgi:hypothetical protein
MVEGSGKFNTVEAPYSPEGGKVAPGINHTMGASFDDLGILSWTGNYAQDAAGSLDIRLGSAQTDPMTGLPQYDRLAVDGFSLLGGTLNVSLVDGFVINPSDTFDILTSTNGLSGFFQNASTSVDTTDGLGRFDVTYIPGFGSSPGIVRLSDFTPVPEPSALVLAALGAVGMFGYAWQRWKRA